MPPSCRESRLCLDNEFTKLSGDAQDLAWCSQLPSVCLCLSLPHSNVCYLCLFLLPSPPRLSVSTALCPDFTGLPAPLRLHFPSPPQFLSTPTPPSQLLHHPMTAPPAHSCFYLDIYFLALISCPPCLPSLFPLSLAPFLLLHPFPLVLPPPPFSFNPTPPDLPFAVCTGLMVPLVGGRSHTSEV